MDRRVSAENRIPFEKLTEYADLLLSSGDFNIYHHTREQLQRQLAQQQSKKAQSSGNGTAGGGQRWGTAAPSDVPGSRPVDSTNAVTPALHDILQLTERPEGPAEHFGNGTPSAGVHDAGPTSSAAAMEDLGDSREEEMMDMFAEEGDASQMPAAGTSGGGVSGAQAVEGGSDRRSTQGSQFEGQVPPGVRQPEHLGSQPGGQKDAAEATAGCSSADVQTLHGVSTSAAGDALQDEQSRMAAEGFIMDPHLGYYLNSALGYYYDPRTQLFGEASSGLWYRYENGEYIVAS